MYLYLFVNEMRNNIRFLLFCGITHLKIILIHDIKIILIILKITQAYGLMRLNEAGAESRKSVVPVIHIV